MGNVYQCNSCYTKLGQHWMKYLCVHSSSIIHLSTTKKLAPSISVGFHKNSLIVVCCTFDRFKFRTLIPSRFKNQTNDTSKPLGYNWNHQQAFLKQKIVTLHRCGFNLKFPKHLFWWLFWVNTRIIVTKNSNHNGPNDYVCTVALL